MLYREIMAICSEIHTKHINTLCGQNVEFLKLNFVVQEVTKGLKTFVKRNSLNSDVYAKEQQNITPLNALANLIQEIVTRCVSNNGHSANVWHKMSSAWNIWTDRLRDSASCLVSFINVTGWDCCTKRLACCSILNFVKRTSHSLKYGASVGKSNSDTCLKPNVT